MPGDDLNDPTARATNWARAQIDRRREMEERLEAWDKAHPTAHPWKLDPHLLKVDVSDKIERPFILIGRS
jgi:hypothetical protein